MEKKFKWKCFSSLVPQTDAQRILQYSSPTEWSFKEEKIQPKMNGESAVWGILVSFFFSQKAVKTSEKAKNLVLLTFPCWWTQIWQVSSPTYRWQSRGLVTGSDPISLLVMRQKLSLLILEKLLIIRSLTSLLTQRNELIWTFKRACEWIETIVWCPATSIKGNKGCLTSDASKGEEREKRRIDHA